MTDKPHVTNGPARRAAHRNARGVLAERTLDLIALASLLALITAVFLMTGPQAFAAVTSVGTGLFTAWRGRRRER
jgi:hypothetical protein